jgi:hypothetical protein
MKNECSNVCSMSYMMVVYACSCISLCVHRMDGYCTTVIGQLSIDFILGAGGEIKIQPIVFYLRTRDPLHPSSIYLE